MTKLTVGLLIVITWITVATSQVELPCDSPLRQFPSLARYFEHCICRYLPWTDMTPLQNATRFAAPFLQCKSELAILGERWQLAISGYECNGTVCEECEHKHEDGYICISTCNRSEWTDVAPNVTARHIAVPTTQCKSGLALPGERWQIALGGYECNGTECKECRDIREERYICEPTVTERVILNFDLGPTGQDHNSVQNCSSCGLRTRRAVPQSCPIHEKICRATQVCNTDSHQCGNQQVGRRSIPEQMERTHTNSHRSIAEPVPLPIDPIPFDLIKHRGRYRRQSVNCEPDGTRYVVFVIDTSGSIGPENFTIITSALSVLVHYFCNRIKVAVLTFNGDHYTEFCFDCFDNDCAGRDTVRDVMSSIRYRDGGTHTGEATQCLCDFVLTPKCGFPILTREKTTCLDVVYITDGMSNGPADVCEKVQCLYDLRCMGVALNVFAFGIGNNTNKTELQCITRSRSYNYINNAIFDVGNFTLFAKAIHLIRETFESTATPPPGTNAGPQYAYGCFDIEAEDSVSNDVCSSYII